MIFTRNSRPAGQTAIEKFADGGGGFSCDRLPLEQMLASRNAQNKLVRLNEFS
jgi:hypothetical protein